jgi:hypothetical protein
VFRGLVPAFVGSAPGGTVEIQSYPFSRLDFTSGVVNVWRGTKSNCF